MSLSPNFGPRRDGLRPELVVLHYTAMADGSAAERVLCTPEREVSAHYLIHRDGRISTLVEESMRAWHAGAGSWAGQRDVNSRSIGIELDNDGRSPFSAPLMASLETLLPGILDRWAIRPSGVIGHSDMAPDRKIDPGPRFDWQRLARGELSVWPSPSHAHAPVSAFRDAAITFGYPADIDDALLLKAVRLRFRPWATGACTVEDASLIADLANRFPVDAFPGTA